MRDFTDRLAAQALWTVGEQIPNAEKRVLDSHAGAPVGCWCKWGAPHAIRTALAWAARDGLGVWAYALHA